MTDIKQKKKIYKITQWLEDSTRHNLDLDAKGRKLYPKKNIEFLHLLSECDEKFAKLGVICFFVRTRLGVRYAWTMMNSVSKQRSLILVCIRQLKEYKLRESDLSAFKRDITSLNNRYKHVMRILEEDIKLTEYYPYFKSVGFEILEGFDIPTFEEMQEMYQEKSVLGNSLIDHIIADIEAYKAEHMDEIAEHMKWAESEQERINKHKQMLREKAMEERKADREAQKAEEAYIKEIERNRKKDKERSRKIDREIMVNAGWI